MSSFFSLVYLFAKKYSERHCGPSRGSLTAKPIVPRNNQDHIGLSRIKNINFKLSRWHRPLWRITYRDPEGVGCIRAINGAAHRERLGRTVITGT